MFIYRLVLLSLGINTLGRSIVHRIQSIINQKIFLNCTIPPIRVLSEDQANKNNTEKLLTRAFN